MGVEKYMIVHRKGKIILERYGGFVFLVPFIDSITILTILNQETPVNTILFHEEMYLELNVNIKWQINNPKDTFYEFDLQHKKRIIRLLGMELGEILVTVFKYITVGSDMDETIADPNTFVNKLKDEVDAILAKKGIMVTNFELVDINKIDPIEFEKIKSKYQRLNLRKHESDKELNKDKAKHTLGGAEVYMRSLMWG